MNRTGNAILLCIVVGGMAVPMDARWQQSVEHTLTVDSTRSAPWHAGILAVNRVPAMSPPLCLLNVHTIRE